MLQDHEDGHGCQTDIRQEGRTHKGTYVHRLHCPYDNVHTEKEIPARLNNQLNIRIAKEI